MTKSLGILSRSVINRNIKIQDIDSLSLPQVLKNECFENTTFDRCDDGKPQSLKPCECGGFPKYGDWCHYLSDCRECVRLSLYSITFPEIPTDVEWLELPDRQSLLKLYRSAVGEKRQMLEACLNTVRFQDSTGLGEVHKWIRRFLFYRFKYGWYYLSLDAHLFAKFIEVMKYSDVVILPYGCVNKDANFRWFSDHQCHGTHKREMIVVFRSKNFPLHNFYRHYVDCWYSDYTSIRMRDVTHFIHTIYGLCRNRHFCTTPMIHHGIWWMRLLVPQGYFDNTLSECQTRDIESLQNCVVKFDPLHQRIGDVIRNSQRHIEKNGGFVYWFDGRMLEVKEMNDVPPFIAKADFPEWTFIEWCSSTGINTLINLNGYKFNGGKWTLNNLFDVKTNWSDESDDSSSDDEGVNLRNVFFFKPTKTKKTKR